MQEAGYCECGCGQKTRVPTRTNRSNGEVRGVPMRFVHGHNARPSLEGRYVIDSGGCWVWQGKTNQHGYGRMRQIYREVLAHRFYYERFVGPIPDGLDLDHLCRNTRCVNPAHLEPVTHGENVRRGRGTKFTDEQIRAIYAAPGPYRQIAERFGTSAQYVGHIKAGRVRGHALHGIVETG